MSHMETNVNSLPVDENALDHWISEPSAELIEMRSQILGHPEGKSETEYVLDVLNRFGERAFRRRSPSQAYLDSIVAIYRDLREEGTSLPLQLEVMMICYGCDVLDANVYGFPETVSSGGFAPFGRALSWNGPGDENRARRTQLDDVCQCDAKLPRHAPLEVDVLTEMDPILQGFALPCTGNTTECNFGDTFVTNLLLQVDLDIVVAAA